MEMNENNYSCFLCGHECQKTNKPEKSINYYDCKWCGLYGISNAAETEHNEDLSLKLRGSIIARERKLANLGSFVLVTKLPEQSPEHPIILIGDFLSLYPQRPSEFFDRSLLNLSRMIGHPSKCIHLEENDYSVLFSSTEEEFKYMVKQLVDLGYIRSETTAGIFTSIYIQAKGWQEISNLSSTAIGTKNQAFVAMWFSDQTETIYEKAIKPAIEHDGVIKSLRIDCLEHNNKICDQIIAEIRCSKYLVADFTGNRGGVYYEAGFAHGLGLPVIWCVKEEEIDNLHFDTRQYNHIPYNNTEDLYKKLLNRIKATI